MCWKHDAGVVLFRVDHGTGAVKELGEITSDTVRKHARKLTRVLSTAVTAEVPPQDLAIDLGRLPPRPASD